MRDRAARDVDALNRIDSIMRTGEDNRLRIVAPIEVVNPIQVSLADHARLAGGAIDHGDAKQIRLVARLLLHAIADVLAIWRIFRRSVPRWIR